jgi:hypothetical protein
MAGLIRKLFDPTWIDSGHNLWKELVPEWIRKPIEQVLRASVVSLLTVLAATNEKIAEFGALGYVVVAMVIACLYLGIVLALRGLRSRWQPTSTLAREADQQTARSPAPPLPSGANPAAARVHVSDPLPRESDKDKEAKDAIVRFCRAHLYKLIEQERRCINLIIRELLGDDPQSTIVIRYAEKAIRSEFCVEPRIVAATKYSAYRESYTRPQLEGLLAEANEFTVERSIFISQALRERGFDRRTAIQIATELCKARESVKTAWAELAGNPTYDTFQTKIGQSENSRGHLWMPPTSESSAKN